jgi:chemotaxis protein methyltransferase CheR
MNPFFSTPVPIASAQAKRKGSMNAQSELLAPARAGRGAAQADFARFQSLVRKSCGLVLPEVRRRDLERVVAQSLEATGLATPDDLYAHMNDRTGRRTLEEFLGALTVGETHFFRNRPQFEALQYHLLPELIEMSRPTRRLRIWSAGCSSGEEPYSIAMQLRTLIPDIDRWSITILATDINPSALDRAERALYGAWSFREVPPLMKARFFRPVEAGFEVLDEVRSMVTFRYLNLVSDAYPSLPTNTVGMDLVLCRNVLIYFDEATVERVVGRLHAALADAGKLVVAPAEFSQETFRSFQTLNFPGTVVYKKPDPNDAVSATLEAAGVCGGIVSVAPFQVPNQPPATVIEHAAGAPAAAPESSDEDIDPLLEQTRAREGDAEVAYAAAKALAGRLELEDAEHYASLAIERDPLFARAHHLKGLILIEQNRLDDALNALRACVFADRSFALGHYTLSGAFARLGQAARARKALENAAGLLSDVAPETELEDGDGLTAGRLLEMVEVQRSLLHGGAGRS